MEAVIATLDTLWFAYPAFAVILALIVRFVSGLTFRQLAKEIFAPTEQAALVAEGYEIDEELDRQIDALCEAEDIRHEVLLAAGLEGEAGDW